MPSSRPHAAIYVPHGAVPDRRGFAPAIVAWETARRLRRVSPYIISAREGYRASEETVEGIPVYRLRESALYQRLFRKITRLDPWPLHRRAARIVRGVPTDLIHVHQIEFPVDAFRRAVGRKLPVLVHAHVTTNPFDPARGVADRYLAASHHVRERLIAKGYPDDRTEVVYNGVDTGLFAPVPAPRRASLRREFGIPEGAVVLAFVGRKQEVKGFHVFLRVVERLGARHKELYAVAAGPEPANARRDATFDEREACRHRLAARGRILDLPAQSHARLADLFRVADILLLPSQSEPQGMVMIEALASGAVVVSSNTGGIRESIRHGETGFLLDRPDNDEEASACVENVLRRLESLDSMRAAARRDMVARFDWRAVTDQLERIYLNTVMRSTTE
jgi:glycosyltransferase involved in cell wall biosynthesis